MSARRDFGWYWSGQSVSVLGDQIAVFVLLAGAIAGSGSLVLRHPSIRGLRIVGGAADVGPSDDTPDGNSAGLGSPAAGPTGPIGSTGRNGG